MTNEEQLTQKIVEVLNDVASIETADNGESGYCLAHRDLPAFTTALLPLLQQRETEWFYPERGEYPSSGQLVWRILKGAEEIKQRLYHKSLDYRWFEDDVLCWTPVQIPTPPNVQN